MKHLSVEEKRMMSPQIKHMMLYSAQGKGNKRKSSDIVGGEESGGERGMVGLTDCCRGS